MLVPLYFITHADLYLTLSDDKIQTDHILITDVNQRNEYSLICWHHSRRVINTFSWYHEFIEHSPSDKRHKIPRKIAQNLSYYFGWSSVQNGSVLKRNLKLLRHPDTLAVEGVFTCEAGRAAGGVSITSVGIHYPSELVKL